MCPLPVTVLQNYLELLFPSLCCVKMEEITPPSSSLSTSVLVIGLVALLAKGRECGELVLPSLPLLVRRTEEREELVCGTELTGRQSSADESVSVESEEEEEQGGGRGRAWQHSLPCNVEDNVYTEPHLEVDKDEEPKIVPVQET